MTLVPKRAIGVLAVLLMLLPFAAVPTHAEDSYQGNVRIGQGDNHYWKVSGQGTLEFTVEVVTGGPVDVLITDDVPTGMVFYYEGHDYIRTSSVKGKFPMGSEGTVYLVVDNSNDVGVDTTGDVTVDVEWELSGQTSAWLAGVLVPIIFLILIVAGLVITVRRRTSRPRYDDTVVEDVYVDERGQVLGVSSGPPARGRAPHEPQWCPSCGAEMQWDDYYGRSYCPHCRT